MIAHFRPEVRIPAGYRGRVCCGLLVPGERATMNWKRVTCWRCRRTIAFENAVSRWQMRNAGHPLSSLEALGRIKRQGWPPTET